MKNLKEMKLAVIVDNENLFKKCLEIKKLINEYKKLKKKNEKI